MHHTAKPLSWALIRGQSEAMAGRSGKHIPRCVLESQEPE
jgi:hypothetical protein